jgi:hypothetical protein
MKTNSSTSTDEEISLLINVTSNLVIKTPVIQCSLFWLRSCIILRLLNKSTSDIILYIALLIGLVNVFTFITAVLLCRPLLTQVLMDDALELVQPGHLMSKSFNGVVIQCWYVKVYLEVFKMIFP